MNETRAQVGCTPTYVETLAQGLRSLEDNSTGTVTAEGTTLSIVGPLTLANAITEGNTGRQGGFQACKGCITSARAGVHLRPRGAVASNRQSLAQAVPPTSVPAPSTQPPQRRCFCPGPARPQSAMPLIRTKTSLRLVLKTQTPARRPLPTSTPAKALGASMPG